MPSKVPLFFKIGPRAKWCSFYRGRQSIMGISGQNALGSSSFLALGNAYAIASAIQCY